MNLAVGQYLVAHRRAAISLRVGKDSSRSTYNAKGSYDVQKEGRVSSERQERVCSCETR